MIKNATVIEAADLYMYAEQKGIAFYNEIQHIIFRNEDRDHQRRHHLWWKPAFTVGIDDFDEYWDEDQIKWDNRVTTMVKGFMEENDIKVLVICDKHAHLINPLPVPPVEEREE